MISLCVREATDIHSGRLRLEEGGILQSIRESFTGHCHTAIGKVRGSRIKTKGGTSESIHLMTSGR